MFCFSCLYHPNIALLLATCRGTKTLGQYLVFEPLEHHYLHRLLYEEKLQLVEDSILNLAHDVANAMQYLHNMGFLHCYLGSQSVMVTRDYTAKVSTLLTSFQSSLIEVRFPTPHEQPRTLNPGASVAGGVESEQARKRAWVRTSPHTFARLL